MATTTNQALLDASVRHQVWLQRFSATEAKKTAALLADADKDLTKRIGQAYAAGETTSAKRLSALLADIKRMRKAVLQTKLPKKLTPELQTLAVDEALRERLMIEGSIPFDIKLASVPVATAKAAAETSIQGVSLDGWLAGITQQEAIKLDRQIRLGVIEGDTVQQMVSRTKAITGQTTSQAESLVRTAVNNVSNAARSEVWKANADIISELRWTATLDGRTSAICQSRDGQTFPMDSGPRPPAHFNCRSLMVPVIDGVAAIGDRPMVRDTRTRKEREVDFRADAKQAAGPKWKGMSQAERNASIAKLRDKWAAENIGTVPSSTTYEEWLRRQPKEFQNEVLGTGKAKLFRDGATLDKFVDAYGKEVPLAKVQAEWQGDALNVLQPAIGQKAKALLQQGLSSSDTLSAIQAEFPDASTSAASIASYKTELKKAGLLNTITGLPPGQTTAVKGATGLLNVAQGLEEALDPGVKQAIGGQWLTVVDKLDGAPNAYAHYKAGQGVFVSAEKLSGVQVAQAQQVMAHEMGHMLHKAHDLKLPPETFSGMKQVAKNLDGDMKKLYSYYLTTPDELVAEVYAQALSPSPLTSQGLDAKGFKEIFGPHIAAAKEAMKLKWPQPSGIIQPPVATGASVTAGAVPGNFTSIGAYSKALLQQGLPDDDILSLVKAKFPDAKTTKASLASYKVELKKIGMLPTKGTGPVPFHIANGQAPEMPKPLPNATGTPSAVATVDSSPTATSTALMDEVAKLEKSDQKLVLKQIAKLEAGVSPSHIYNDIFNTSYDISPKQAQYLTGLAQAEVLKKQLAAVPVFPTHMTYAKQLKVDAKTLQLANEMAKKGLSPEVLYEVLKKVGLSSSGESLSSVKGTLVNVVNAATTKFQPNVGFKYALDVNGTKVAGSQYVAPTMKATSASPTAKLLEEAEKIVENMTPARPALSPSEGWPPPPRYTPEQRRASLIKILRQPPENVISPSEVDTFNRNHALNKADPLTVEELAVLRHYTGSSYRTTNGMLRKGDYSNNYVLQAYTELAQSAIRKIKPHVGVTNRGMSLYGDELKKFLSVYKSGEIVEDAAFVSTSTSSGFGGNIRIEVRGKTGAKVSSISYYRNEAEVLFAPGARFKVQQVTQKSGDNYHVVLEEV